MIKIIFTALLCVCVLACSNNKSVEEKVVTEESLKAEIKSVDDSLYMQYQLLKQNKIEDIHPNYFINATQNYLAFFRKYPDDAFAPECLDKVQQLFTQQKLYDLTLKYCDTLLMKYPKYKGNPAVLLNAGSIADGIIHDKKLTQKYYSKLLKDYPSIDPETKEMVEFRLKHIDLSFDELIELQAKKIAQKK
jgi:TolA-binding protein